MMYRIAIVGVVSALCAGCATLDGRIDYFEMAPRLEYTGFSFDRPPGPEWFIVDAEQTYTSVTLRRETRSETHSFYAIVALSGLEDQPGSHEEFLELARPRRQQASYSVEELSREQSPVSIQNQWCLRFDTLAAVRGAPIAPDRELRMTVRGFRCLHPANPRTTLDFYYSERGLPDEIDPELADEGERFLRGVRIDVAPGTPAT